MTDTELKKLITDVSSLFSVTGYTMRESRKLTELVGGYFDESSADRIGNHLFVRRCGKENPLKILVDCHFDEIGMMVTSVKEGGFLTVTSVGGVDTRILQASEVTVYGKDEDGNEKNIYAVVGSTPPHLQKPGEANKLKKMEELLIDTGYTKEELEKFVRPGTPVGFRPIYAGLLNGRIAGKGFDDKACGACAIAGIAEARKEDLIGDVYFLFSNFEEDGTSFGGGYTGAWAVDPDVALVADVNHAHTPDTKKTDTVEMDKGCAITFSPLTDRALTKLLVKLCGEKNIPVQPSFATRSTGTNTVVINNSRCGIPTVDIGLPLKSMHTSGETLSMKDAEAMKELVKLFITSEEVAKELGND